MRHIQKECQASIPSYWEDKEAYHITNEPPYEAEDLFHRWKGQDQYVPEVHNSTGERRPVCVDFYTHNTKENEVDDRSK